MTYPEPINAHDCVYPIEANCQDGVILGFEDGQWKFMSPESFKLRGLKWWLRVPPKPVEVPEVERAWMEYVEAPDNSCHQSELEEEAFRAGWEARGRAKA